MLVRKTVTILFSDVVTYTGLGERLDPESLRRLMSRYFDEMRAVIERHGGTVEKFIGDEVMAVFGVPTVHEDDGLRAVRAAAEMRDRLTELNDELEATWGVRLEARTGINTGQVVAGDPATGGTFVTGEPVVLAKRLEQAAGAGEILIGKATYPLVREAVKAGPLESFSVKGKAQHVEPFRLHEVEAGAPGFARRLDAPIVGRQAELALLRDAFDRARNERCCELVTILGTAGIGKSRLATELVASVGDEATTLTGRCLPYGEGITFWPLVQIVRQAGGEAGVAGALAGDEDAELVAERIRGLTGAAPPGGATAETFWAVRRFFEALARRKPLLVCFEDIHWAEPTLLELIEYLAVWSHDEPILLLCLARQDLLDARPAWASLTADSSLFTLEPLSEAHSEELLATLGEEVALSTRESEQIAAAAEGNPLYLEQMVAMAAEEGVDGALPIPPSIQALLAERLDRLDAGERAVIERAAVAGKDFLRSDVAVLCWPELRLDVDRHLMALVRKELVRPDPSVVGRDDGFRFKHALIRDAAYDGLPKEVRAELHEVFASWMEANADERAAELEEIMGYHLEQAFRYREQLGPVDDDARALATKGASLLGQAGRRAYARGDMPGAAALLTRATILLADEDERRVALAPELGAALIATGELIRAEAVLDRAVETAGALGARLHQSHAILERAHLRLQIHREGAVRAADEAEQALRAFEELDDELGQARALHLLASVQANRSQWGAAEQILQRALGHAERAGAQRERASILLALASALYSGPAPVEEAIERCTEILARASGDRTLQAGTANLSAPLEAMRGRFNEARRLCAKSRAAFEDLGAAFWLASAHFYSGEVELLAGDPAAAEREFAQVLRTLEGIGARNVLSTTAALLADAIYRQGRLDEAERHCAASREAASRDDAVSQVAWRRTLARVLARKGEHQEAAKLALEAVSIAELTDSPNLHADALTALAEVGRLTGDDSEAFQALERALELHTMKGNTVSAAEVRRALSRLGAQSRTGSPQLGS